ncbi:DUF2332 domain-containing protein [Rhizobium sp. TRM95796]|uniref:DUF2332 domain-containing protein n=1 Tax=Rhizobium sp. TRM95796 TaxID=2979862 RepID=UPI0021E991F0|nr:DUF2332 family protein [Rhizobium sp. TRM95796]MCV3765035.1 DUF2332 family protein [Rhizobium sp. TRM95796]
MTINAVRHAFERQSAACDALGSPFTARLCRLISARLTPGGAIADRLLNWSGDPSPQADSVPLRLAGCLHALVLEGLAPDLISVYPPHDAPDDRLWNAVEKALADHADFILARLRSAPQTNEVRRSGALLPGFLTIAELLGKPLVLSEVGASAGLNLQWDRYRYRLGDLAWGDPASTVEIAPDWHGEAPPEARISVLERAGCDLHPVNAADPAHRLRMLSYIWADQEDRLSRTRAALDIAARHGVTVEQADAIDWLGTRLASPRPGAVHVIFHTIAWQYLPAPLQAEGEALIAAAGGHATDDAPLARLALEADDRSHDGAALTLEIWPGGAKKEIGRGDFHGRWIRWAGW